jgi:Flp pilus assembly protein CpaB
VWWLAAASVAALAAVRVGGLDDAADARRRAWGESTTVAVAARDLPAGTVVVGDDITVEEWPAALVPDGALAEPPTGSTITASVVAGEAVVGARVAPGGLSGVAALIPAGHRAVAVPGSAGGLGTDTPPLRVGDRVDVLATFDVLDPTDGSASTEPTGTVADGALVVDVSDEAVTVAVPAADAARVAFAAARGTITLALVGAG